MKMKNLNFFLYVLLGVLTGSCQSCKKLKVVPDQTITGSHTGHLKPENKGDKAEGDAEEAQQEQQKKIPKILADRWNKFLNFLQDKQYETFRDGLRNLRKSARDIIFDIISCVPTNGQKDFVQDLVCFGPDKFRRLLNILCYFYEKRRKELLSVCADPEHIGFFTRIKLGALIISLPAKDAALVKKLIAELQKPNDD